MYNFKVLTAPVLCLSLMGAAIASAQTVPGPPTMPSPPSMDFFELKQESVDPSLISTAAPVMPAEATRSGYCCVAFDIGTEGRAINIKADYCSEPLFEVAAKTTVGKAEFTPAKVGGVRRISEGHSFDVTFKKEDVNGVIKPSLDGKFTQSAVDSGQSFCN